MARDTAKMKLGKRIAAARKDVGLTQPELASACGWLQDGAPAQTRVSNYERGAREPGVEEVQEIARVTGRKLLYFYDFENELESNNARREKVQEYTANMSAPQAMELLTLIRAALPPVDLAKAAAMFSAAVVKNHERPKT